MTDQNLRLLDIYTDYLLSSFGATTATGLSRILPEVSHDQVTRFLSQPVLGAKALWKLIKPQVRAMESPEGVLILDDCVQEKPYSDQSELIAWHYDHAKGRVVKGINLLTALYYSQGVSLPIDFAVIQKTELATDARTGKDKWVSPKSKNEIARAMIQGACRKQMPFGYVLADAWFACAETMNFVVEAKKQWIMPLKSNRRVARSEAAKERGRWTRLDALTLAEGALVTLHLEGVTHPIAVSRHVFKNEDGSQGLLYLASSDLDLCAAAMWAIYQKRWKVEEYHKSLKQNAALAKSPTKLPHTQQNHIFASLVAFCKLEAYRTQTHLNHFALKAKLYHAALHSAWEQLRLLKHQNTDPITNLHCVT